MSRFLVAGLINIETTLAVDAFPVEYAPVRYPFFGVKSTVSGVGLNIAKAFHTLNHNVDLLSLIGRDIHEPMIRQELRHSGISDQNVLSRLESTAQSVILYEKSGRRAIFTDLKDIQEQAFPQDSAKPALLSCDIAIICNIKFARPLLQQAVELGKTVATDVHAISDLEDEYNRDWIQHADILFMSHERLPVSPEEWIQKLWHRYQTEITVIGMGENGALLGIRDEQRIEHVPAIQNHKLVSTIGAGDALFSAFLHAYSQSSDPVLALQKAVIFVSSKIGSSGAAEGFIDSETLDRLFIQHYG